MSSPWPDSFDRVPEADWTTLPLGELALKYDTVEHHGWYANLEPTLEQLDRALRPGDLLVDYSGGTGILLDRLLKRIGDRPVRAILVDSSPRFLRVALEKLREEPRLAFRRIHYLKAERRLQWLDEVLPPGALDRPVDALVSTNAVHLYYDLPDTLASWRRVMRAGGGVFVQSGNIRNPHADSDTWIIDETVHSIHDQARAMVRADGRWSRWREVLEDPDRMAAYDRLRHKFFLPVRPLEHYVEALTRAGFAVDRVEWRRIEARVEEWYAFLAAYHEGVLGWVGGSRRVEGVEPTDEAVADRLELIRRAMDAVFGGRPSFPCAWTYLVATAR